jgi:hypothetical protein
VKFPAIATAWARVWAVAIAAAALLYRLVPPDLTVAHDPLTGQPFKFNRCNLYQVPLVLTWGLEGFRSAPFELVAAAAVVLVGLCAYPWRQVTPVSATKLRALAVPRLSRAGAIALAAALGVLASIVLRVSYPVLFGDAPDLVVQIEDGMTFAADAATTQLFQLARWLLEACFHDGSGLHAAIAVDYAAVAAFAGALASFAWTVGRGPAERVLLFFGTAAAGCTTMFFGYVETTQVESTAMALYFAAAAAAITGPRAGRASPARVAAFAALGLAVTAHAAGILLLPSALLLVVDVFARPRAPVRELAARAVTIDNVAALVLLIAAPFVLSVYLPFYAHGDFGNVSGGADHIRWVPATIDYASRPSNWVYYSRFSAWHLADIANAVFVAAPLALPLGAATLALRRRAGDALDHDERSVLALLGCVAAACAAIPLFWNHDYAIWGDWNISATYLFPLHVLTWTAFVVASRRFERGLAFYLGVAAPMLAAQAIAWLGLLAQLY